MNNAEKIMNASDKLEEAQKDTNENEVRRRFNHAYHKLSKPFTYCGTTYEELDMDFEGLTGRMMEAIDDELAAMNITVAAPALSHRYQRMVAAKAAKVPSDMIEALPLGDYNAITGAARRFLLATG